MLNVFFSALMAHTASVQTYLGSSPTGDRYATAVEVKGFYDDGLVRVQNAQGEQLVQKSRFYTEVSEHAKFVPESLVTINSRPSQVTVVHRREAGSVFAPVAHLEVELT